MPGRRDFHKLIIGRSELLSFVEHGLVDIPAKTDTGAYRSAIHATDIQLDADPGILSFVLLSNHSVCDNQQARVQTKEFSQVRVENSFGQTEDRYEVKLKVKLGPKVFFDHFTLADRSGKIYPILLGRKLLNDRFIVDSAESAIDRSELRKRYNLSFSPSEEEMEET